MYRLKICLQRVLSFSSIAVSRMIYIKSNRERRVGARLIFSTTVLFLLYFDSTGLAAARMAVLVFNYATIPAFAIDIVCYSIASCKIDLVFSSILSNSSIQHIPMSDKTKAPDSKTISLVSGSLVT